MVYLLRDVLYSAIALPAEVLFGAFVLVILQCLVFGIYYGSITLQEIIKTKRKFVAGIKENIKDARDARAERKAALAQDASDTAQDEPSLKAPVRAIDAAQNLDDSLVVESRRLDMLYYALIVSNKTATYLRPTLRYATTLSFVLIIIFLLLNQFFLAPIVTRQLNSVLGDNGAVYQFKGFSGNLITGNMHFDDLVIWKRSSDDTAYKITVGTLAMKIRFSSLFLRPIKIKSLRLSDVQGKVRYRNSYSPNFLMRSFLVESLVLERLSVNVEFPKRHKMIHLKLSSLQSDSIRSEYALFDLLFSSTVTGSINEADFKMRFEKTEEARATEWQINDFPARLLADLIDEAPLNWFVDGQVSLVTNGFKQLAASELKSTWYFNVHQLRVALPKDLPPFLINRYDRIVDAVNSASGDYEFQFEIPLRESDFKHAYQDGMHVLWKDMGQSMIGKIKPTDYHMF